MARWLVFRNPPDHSRIRSAMHRAFTPAAIRHLEETALRLADGLVDGLSPGQRVDLVATVASPLPTLVIAEILGVSPTDHSRFRDWSAALAPSLDMICTPAELRDAAAAAKEMRDYLEQAAEERRRRPRGDVLSELVAPTQGGEPLGADDLLANCVFLLAAGHETTTHVIATGVRALLLEGEPWERLVHDPPLVAGAVEELLRWEAPVQLTFRDALEDGEIAGQQVRAGQQVAAVLGSANRDPERFPEPDRLDITRPEASHHLTFSGGIHYCLGASLARMEVAVALAALTRRWPGMRLDGEPTWRSSVLLRGLGSLPVVAAS
jgi:pimeloyl-[acyl-carrier protein] synthase